VREVTYRGEYFVVSRRIELDDVGTTELPRLTYELDSRALNTRLQREDHVPVTV
jgi:hypothetical protein